MMTLMEAKEPARSEQLSAEEVEVLQARLEALLGRTVQQLRLRLESDGLVLEGRARCFYAKQLAQAHLRRLCSVPIRANHIEVE